MWAGKESGREGLWGRRRALRLGITVLVLAVATIVLRRQGYGVGGNAVVRCRQGHLFTTLWIPGVSFKSLRLGWWRVQWCPVGRHWTIVVPVKAADLTEEERVAAQAAKDIRIP